VQAVVRPRQEPVLRRRPRQRLAQPAGSGSFAALGAEAGADAPASVSIRATMVPTATVSPSCTSTSERTPGIGGRNLGVHLVGRDLEDRLVPLDGVADLLEPPGHRPLGDGLAHLRHDDVDPWPSPLLQSENVQ
jgi:hypothetical protein